MDYSYPVPWAAFGVKYHGECAAPATITSFKIGINSQAGGYANQTEDMVTENPVGTAPPPPTYTSSCPGAFTAIGEIFADSTLDVTWRWSSTVRPKPARGWKVVDATPDAAPVTDPAKTLWTVDPTELANHPGVYGFQNHTVPTGLTGLRIQATDDPACFIGFAVTTDTNGNATAIGPAYTDPNGGKTADPGTGSPLAPAPTGSDGTGAGAGSDSGNTANDGSADCGTLDLVCWAKWAVLPPSDFSQQMQDAMPTDVQSKFPWGVYFMGKDLIDQIDAGSYYTDQGGCPYDFHSDIGTVPGEPDGQLANDGCGTATVLPSIKVGITCPGVANCASLSAEHDLHWLGPDSNAGRFLHEIRPITTTALIIMMYLPLGLFLMKRWVFKNTL